MNKSVSNDIFREVSFEDKCSVVVVTHNRTALLRRLVETLGLALARSGLQACHVVFCVNGSDKNSAEFLKNSSEANRLRSSIVQLPKAVTPAEARNVASREISTEWIFFLDDDVEVPLELFENFLKLNTANPQVSLWGGPNLTPPQSKPAQHRIGWYLGHTLVTGPIARRYKFNAANAQAGGEFTFSLCNMFVKTQVFNEIQFNINLKTAEENELIYRIAKKSLRMCTSDGLFVWHSRRDNMSGFLRQIQNYGFGRGQLIHNGHVSHLVPTLIVLSSLAAMVMLLNYPLQLLAAFIVWQLIIFGHLIRTFGMSQETVKEIFFPAQIWFRYAYGVYSGFVRAPEIERLQLNRLNKANPS